MLCKAVQGERIEGGQEVIMSKVDAEKDEEGRRDNENDHND